MKRGGDDTELLKNIEMKPAFEPLQVLNPLNGANNIFIVDWSGLPDGFSIRNLRGRMWTALYGGPNSSRKRIGRVSTG